MRDGPRPDSLLPVARELHQVSTNAELEQVPPSEPDVEALPVSREAPRGGTAWIPLAGIAAMGVVLAVVMITGLVTEMRVYDALFENAREATRACPGVYLAFAAALTPYRTFAWFRTAVVLMSFVFVFAGAAFVLGRIRAPFSMSGNWGSRLALDARSPYPGVLMMLMGAVLIGLGMFRSASPRADNLSCGNNPAWSKGRGPGFELDQNLSLNRTPEK